MDRKWATWWGTRSVTSVKPSLRDLQVWPEFTASRECRQVQEPLFVQLCSNDTHFSLLPSFSTFRTSFPRGFRNLVPAYDTDITFLSTFFQARSSNASSIRDVESIEDRWSRLTRAVDRWITLGTGFGSLNSNFFLFATRDTYKMSFHAVSFRNDRGESLEDGDNFNEIGNRNGKTRRFLWISEANQELTKLVAFYQRNVPWWWRYVENIDLFLECKRPANASQTRRFDGRKPRRLVGSNWIEERVDLDGCSLARMGSCGKNDDDRCARGTGSPSDLVEKRKNRERKEKQRKRQREREREMYGVVGNSIAPHDHLSTPAVRRTSQLSAGWRSGRFEAKTLHL